VLRADQLPEYERLRALARSELERVDREIDAELGRARTKLRELTEEKRALKQIYDGASKRLGLSSRAVLSQSDTALVDYLGRLAKHGRRPTSHPYALE